MAKLCMGCMNPWPEGNQTCSVCGFDPATDKNPDNALPTATALQGHYIVGRCMGEYGDHLLYLAYDRQLREPCLIQEFFPNTISRRDTIGGVQPLSGCERVFEEYAAQFRSNMRILARMRELPTVIPVYDIFEENGTVYAASDYCEGMTLAKKIKLAGGRLPWSEARPLFMSLLSCLTQLNEAGILHLGLCPDSILVGADGKPRLRHFSITPARRAGTDLTPQLHTGYAAPEQYSLDGNIGEHTDVYGVAATIFRTVTGNEPPAGNNRSKSSGDLFMPADVAQELTQQVCVALFNALQVAPENRTATIEELRNQLSVEPNVFALVEEVKEDREKEQPVNKPVNKGRTLLIIFGCCLAALLLVVFLIMNAFRSNVPQDSENSSTTLPTLTTTTTADPNLKNQVSVENLVGQSYYTLRDKTLSGEMTIKLSHIMYSGKEAGTILAQTPAAGTVVEKGTEITVVISNGHKDETLSIPDVSGWKEAHAKLYLEALGFKVESVKLQASTYVKGEVEGTTPPIGTSRLVGDTITLRVSDVTEVSTPDEDPVEDSSEDPDDNTLNENE